MLGLRVKVPVSPRLSTLKPRGQGQRKPTGESEDTTGGFRVHTTRGPRFILKLVLSALRVKMEESKRLYEAEDQERGGAGAWT